MAVYFPSNDPKKLLSTFKKAIDEGHVRTWSYDKEGDLTHADTQWMNKAWLRPEIQTDKLVMWIIKPKDKNISREVYAIYHGRIIESMLALCDELFISGIASAMPKENDKVKS